MVHVIAGAIDRPDIRRLDAILEPFEPQLRFAATRRNETTRVPKDGIHQRGPPIAAGLAGDVAWTGWARTRLWEYQLNSDRHFTMGKLK
jgi:hypothetical protein